AMLAMTLPCWSCAQVRPRASNVNGMYPLSLSALPNRSSASASAGGPFWRRATLSVPGTFGSASRPITSVSAVGGGNGAPVSVGDGATVGGMVRGPAVGLGAVLVASRQPLSPRHATVGTPPRTAAQLRGPE